MTSIINDAVFGAKVGFGGRFAANIVGALVELLKKPSSRRRRRTKTTTAQQHPLIALLIGNDALGWAAFFAALKTTHGILLRALDPTDSPDDKIPPLLREHAHWVAGGAAGLCLGIAPKSYRRSLMLFVLMRALEVQSALAQRLGAWPTFGGHGDIASMVFASGVIIYAFISEPQWHGGGYNRFLLSQMGVSKAVYDSIPKLLIGSPLNLASLNAHRAAIGKPPILDALAHVRTAAAFDNVLYDGTPLLEWTLRYMQKGVFVRALPVYAPIAAFTLLRIIAKRVHRRRKKRGGGNRGDSAEDGRGGTPGSGSGDVTSPPNARPSLAATAAAAAARRTCAPNEALAVLDEAEDSPPSGMSTPHTSLSRNSSFGEGEGEVALVSGGETFTTPLPLMKAGEKANAAERKVQPGPVVVLTRLVKDLMRSSVFLAGYCCLAIGTFGIMNRAGLRSRGNVLGVKDATLNGFLGGCCGGAVVAIEHKVRYHRCRGFLPAASAFDSLHFLVPVFSSFSFLP